MSCVTSTTDRPSRRLQPRSTSSTWRCTMTSSAVTGSSAMHQLRLQRERERDRGALPHAAGELVRDSRQPAGLDADQAEQLRRARARAARGPAAALDQHLLDLPADAVDRVERVHRALRDEGDLAPAQRACARAPAGGAGRGPRTGPGRRRSARCSRHHAHQSRARRVVLPQPDSPTSPTTSPRWTAKLAPSTARTAPCVVR